MKISGEISWKWCLSVMIYGFILIKGCVAERTRTTAALSGTVILTCTKPEPDFVIWMHNQTIIFLGPNNQRSDSERFRLLTKYYNDWSLEISGIKKSDEGQYTCKTRKTNLETYMLVIQDTKDESKPSTVLYTTTMSPTSITRSTLSSQVVGNSSAVATSTSTSTTSSQSKQKSHTNISDSSQSSQSKTNSTTTMIYGSTMSDVPSPVITPTTKDSNSLSSTTDRQRNEGAKDGNCILKLVLLVAITQLLLIK